MNVALKTISKSGFTEAFQKVELYRYLNEPEEAESICRDILAVEPENQLALRLLGLTLTDQFLGVSSDRYGEVESAFRSLKDAYERSYYMGLLNERRAKAQLRAGHPPHSLLPLFEEAMRVVSPKRKRSGRLATMTPSCAGTVASDCCRAAPTLSGREPWSYLTPKTVPQSRPFL